MHGPETNFCCVAVKAVLLTLLLVQLNLHCHRLPQLSSYFLWILWILWIAGTRMTMDLTKMCLVSPSLMMISTLC